jgi:hypothetical protein
MNFLEFQDIVSSNRMHRYLLACNGDQAKAIELYRNNVRASIDMFAIVGAFEIAIRNAIDKQMIANFGSDWLRNSIMPDGIFSAPNCKEHAQIIRSVYTKLAQNEKYSHPDLLANLDFGVWKYMFASPQYRASGQILLNIFPNKPRSTREQQYNNTFIYNELDHVNSLRNRIAHHEPICFTTGLAKVSVEYIRWIYDEIKMLFEWMNIDYEEYLYTMDCVEERCIAIEAFI